MVENYNILIYARSGNVEVTIFDYASQKMYENSNINAILFIISNI